MCHAPLKCLILLFCRQDIPINLKEAFKHQYQHYYKNLYYFKKTIYCCVVVKDMLQYYL